MKIKVLTKTETSIALLFGIAVMLQSYINYIDVRQPLSLLIMPISIIVLTVLVWLFTDNTNKKIFKILSVTLIIINVLWFVFVQYAMALGRGFKN